MNEYIKKVSGEESEAASAGANAQPMAGIMAAAATPTMVDDPKEYLEAPFKYSREDSESVALNSGALMYSATDFVLPGRNGMDLVVARRYDSSVANSEDVDIRLTDVSTWGYKVTYTCKIQESSERVKLNYSDSGFLDKYAAVAAAENKIEKEDNYYEKGVYYSELDGTFVSGSGTYTTQYFGIESVFATQTRPNDHFTTLYGLGLGWSFCFSSIESVSETYKFGSQNKVRYNDFLHLGDGRSYKIDLSTASGLKDYPLADMKLERASGTSPVPYNYILKHKDGNNEYFQVVNSSVSQRSKLVARQDRFGNTIRFTFYDGGGAQIVDSLGRTIQLIRYGSVLKWLLPDGNAIEYTVSGNQLVKVKNQTGQETSFHYTTESAVCTPFETLGDTSVTIPYANLDLITHPTGAQSVYAYSKMDGQTQYGSMQSFVISSRKDVPNPNTTESCNNESFSFASTYDSGKKYSHISSATSTNADGLVTAHTFDKDGLRTSEAVRYSGTTVSSKTFAYTDKLVTTESATIPLAKTTKWSYDSKANLLTQTDPMNAVTTMTYDPSYNILTGKSYQKDAATTIAESYTLSSGKVEWAKISENGSLRQATQYAYDKENRVIEQRQYFNLSLQKSDQDRVVSYSYENDGSIFPAAKTTGNSTERSKYDAFGRVTEKTDANGNTTKITYDALGRVTAELYPDGTSKRTAYDDIKNHIVSTDENGSKKRFEYTPLGLIGKVYDEKTNTLLQACTYDPLSRLENEITYGTGGVKCTTNYTYDHWNRPTAKKQLHPLGSVLYEETVVYNDAFDSAHAQEKKTIAGDSNSPSVVTTIYKDKLGRIEKQGYFIGGTEYFDTFTYDLVGNKKTAQTALDATRGVTTGSWEYDFAGRVTKETNALGQSTETSYDALGNKKQFRDYKVNVTDYTYDALGRLLTQTSPFDGSQKAITKFTYDAAGNVLRQEALCSAPGQTQQWRKTEYRYDTRNRVTDTILYEDNGTESRTRTVYDGVGNKITVYTGMIGDSTAGAAKTTYTYDQFGNVLTMTDPRSNALADSDPLKRIEKFEYDKFGLLLHKTDRNSNTTSYTYDALNRVLSESITVSNPSGTVSSNNSYAYTKTGQKANETRRETRNSKEEALISSYQYDGMGRLIQQTDPDGIVKKYGYDLGGNRTSFALYKGGTLQIDLAYTYDNLNRMSSLKKNGTEIARYTYDVNGNRAALVYPQSGIQTDYAYNDANLVTSLVNKKDGAVRSSYRYAYQLDGNQTSKTDHTGKVTSYIYDKMGRLTQESGVNTIRYAYDRFSNRSKITVTGSEEYTTTYAYTLNNWLEKEEKTSGEVLETALYRYDGNGNQVSRERETLSPATGELGRIAFVTGDSPGEVALLELREYNGFNQLISVYRDGVQTGYRYRPDGLRHSKTSGIAHRSRGQDTVTLHLWDGQNIVAEVGGSGGITARFLRGINLVAREQDNLLQYYLFNAHGDVVQRVDYNGTALKSYEYDAFGVEQNPEKLDSNPWRYCGEYWDKETETVYLRNRYYNPVVGRFASEDPARNGLNWYTYCGGNPILLIDPSGLSGVRADGTYYITHKLDKKLLQLYKQMESADFKSQMKISVEIMKTQSSGKFGEDWSVYVNGERSLDYYNIIDITDKLNGEMDTVKSLYGDKDFDSYIDKLKFFKKQVENKGPYDLKNREDPDWQHSHFMYNGKEIDFDAPGNILYGYFGKVLEISTFLLKGGAGYAQMMARTSAPEDLEIYNFLRYYGDDPRDQANILKGIEIYNKTNK